MTTPPVQQHGYADSRWAGILGWRTRCACGGSFTDGNWHSHAHAVGVDPHGRHLDGAACPCSVLCQEAGE